MECTWFRVLDSRPFCKLNMDADVRIHAVLWLYRFLSSTIGPAVARLAISRDSKLDAATFPERMAKRGLPESLPPGRRIWLNAASVGETVALSTFVKEWRKLNPDDVLFVTNTTATGHERALKLLSREAYWIGYLPLDIPAVVSRAVAALKPAAFITVEAEAWPNLLDELGKSGAKRVLINGRMTLANKQGLKRYITARIWRKFDFVVARSETDRSSFEQLGVAAEKLAVCGEIKLDVEMPRLLESQLSVLRSDFGLAERHCWIAASTHPREEELALRALMSAREVEPQTRLVLVPRHPERFGEVAELVKSNGLECWKYSNGPGGYGAPVLLLDAMGKLTDFYQACGLAVVFGSFYGPGVHSVIEPASYSRPIVVGPRTFNTDLPERMAREAALIRLEKAEFLQEAVRSWATGNRSKYSPVDFVQLGGNAGAFVETNKGAAQRTAHKVHEFLTSAAIQTQISPR